MPGPVTGAIDRAVDRLTALPRAAGEPDAQWNAQSATGPLERLRAYARHAPDRARGQPVALGQPQRSGDLSERTGELAQQTLASLGERVPGGERSQDGNQDCKLALAVVEGHL